MNKKLILGSSSSARISVLNQLNLEFESFSPDIDESMLATETPHQYVLRLSIEKAMAVASKIPHDDAFIIGADQVAVLEQKIYGKPLTIHQAQQYLKELSGQRVHFLSGICVLDKKTRHYKADVSITEIQYKNLSEKEIDDYINLSNPLACAGCLKIEALGCSIIEDYKAVDPFAIFGLATITLSRFLLDLNGHLNQFYKTK